jgi:hypothetical protein
MKKFAIMLLALMLSTAAMAAPATYVEGAYVMGGKNGENGSGSQNGFEVAGSAALSERWYIGGVLGSFDRSSFGDNDYLNINGGMIHSLVEKTDLIVEFGLWAGDQTTNAGANTDPKALEVKFGLSHMIGEKFSVFGTISLVAGDLDTPTDSNLRNFVWSAGGAYMFTKHISASLKIVKGSNGVNGQSNVARAAFRWTF